jgi:hypothetical protein
VYLIAISNTRLEVGISDTVQAAGVAVTDKILDALGLATPAI